MLWFFATASLMIVVGASFSILRNPQTMDYCRTIVRDGRRDNYARRAVTGYNVGLGVFLAGCVLMAVAIALSVLK